MGYVHRYQSRYTLGSRRSAAVVADLLMPLLAPASILDVGCGTGVWLEQFRAAGVAEIHGVDGPWADAAKTLAPGEFTCLDLASEDGAAVRLPRDRYDLVICLEMLEHLPVQQAGAAVSLLARQADTLLVSAAIPLQGSQHHVNERWPEWWARLFAAHGFRPFDGLRLALWNDDRVEPWYRQNMLLYFRGAVPDRVRAWGEELAIAALSEARAIVHPDVFARRFGRLYYALTHPFGFARMLLRESAGQPRRAPPLPHLARSSDD